LEWVQRKRAPDTYHWYRYRIERFVRKFPDLPADCIRPHHVEAWVDDYDFSVTSRRNYLRAIKRCMSWALRQGLVLINPIGCLEAPAGESREIAFNTEEFCENLCLTYCSEGCDGLFLPAVDHLGTRIPVAQIVRTIRRFGGEIRFIMIDAAQALGHVPLDDDWRVADFLVAGTHKWLGSYSTLGLGLAPK